MKLLFLNVRIYRSIYICICIHVYTYTYIYICMYNCFKEGSIVALRYFAMRSVVELKGPKTSYQKGLEFL